MSEAGLQLECLFELGDLPAGRIVGVKRSRILRTVGFPRQPGRRHELGIGGQGKATRPASCAALPNSRIHAFSPRPLGEGPGVRG